MAYKLIAIDIDDTLLNDELEVTSGTQAALEEAIRHGVTVTLATGRMYASAKRIAAQLGLNVPIITYQGALIKNGLDGQVLYERSVSPQQAAVVLAFCKEHKLHLQAYIDDTLYAMEENDKVLRYSRLSGVPYHIEPDFERLLAVPTTKLLIIDEPDRLDALSPELQRLLGNGVHMTKSKPFFLEIMHREGTKGHAVRFLAEHLGYDSAQVIAIGDSWNDKDMIETAGLGVAMANAVPSLHDIADYITLSNNEDGVKHVIDKFVFQRA